MRANPGTTTRITARKALVLAPHADDEVLGCGGLLTQLVQDGAEVRVLFLTDGGPRHQEAAKVADLCGWQLLDPLNLPDGGLWGAGEALTKGIVAAIREERPDLLLLPSPLEISSDHRATFAALHEILAPLRRNSADAEERTLLAMVTGLRILAYEVNHPFYPHLLVEVSGELARLEEAMELYASQQAEHDYLASALALRRFRTLTLPPGVAGAEGYLDLTVDDFTTRSPAQLVAHLGGTPEPGEPVTVTGEETPRLSVIVRTRDRPELLAEALESLAANRYRRAEVVLVNDGGAPPELPADFPLPVVVANLPQNLGRAGAANAGVQAATGDYLCFLDDDDLAAPEHLEVFARLASAAGVRVAYTDAAVGIYELAVEEGWHCTERRLPYSRDFDPELLLVDNYIPFNTLVMERELVLSVGGEGDVFDPTLPFFEDWDFLLRLARQTSFHHLPRVTCEYRHFRGGGHHIFGERPRQRRDFLEVKGRVLARHRDLLGEEVLARVVDTLRAEAVEERERADQGQREAKAAERQAAAALVERHRLNGTVESLRGERAVLQQDLGESGAEIERLHEQERELRGVLAEQEEHLGRTYGEIERLGGEIERLGALVAQKDGEIVEHGEHLGRTYGEIGRLQGLIRTMEESRAWRLHQWVQRRLGR